MGEFYLTDNAFQRDHVPHLSGEAVVLYGHLCYRANADGYCWPTITGIATATKRSRTTVRKALAALVEYGLVQLHEEGERQVFRVVRGRDLPAGGWSQSSQKWTDSIHPDGGQEVSTTGHDLSRSGQILSTPESTPAGQDLSSGWSRSVHKQDSVNKTQYSESLHYRSETQAQRTSHIHFEEPFPEPDADPIPPEPDPLGLLPAPSAEAVAERPVAAPLVAATPAEPAQRPKRQPPKPRTPEAEAKQGAVAAYLEGYQQRHGKRPALTKADTGLLCQALRALKEAEECGWPEALAEFRRVLARFFVDEWISSRGSSASLLPRRLNELRVAPESRGDADGASRERNGRHAGRGAGGWAEERRNDREARERRMDERLIALAEDWPNDPHVLAALERQRQRASGVAGVCH